MQTENCSLLTAWLTKYPASYRVQGSKTMQQLYMRKIYTHNDRSKIGLLRQVHSHHCCTLIGYLNLEPQQRQLTVEMSKIYFLLQIHFGCTQKWCKTERENCGNSNMSWPINWSSLIFIFTAKQIYKLCY